jgi:hypothetical protein
MIELLLPCGFDTLEYSWVKATIDICMLVDYSVAKKHQQVPQIKCMADSASSIDNAPNTSSATKSRTLNLILR